MKYYDEISKGYDKLYAEEQQKKMEIIKNNLSITKKTKILDIGCGTGESSCFDCKVIGIDPSEELIKIAKSKFPNHKFFVEGAENIGKFNFKKKEFDYVLCVSAIHHITELDKTLSLIKEIGKNYVFTVLKKSPKRQNIINTITQYFNIKHKIEEDKDIVLFCN